MLLCLLYLLLPPVKVHIYLGAVLHGHCHEVKAPLVLKMGQQLAERGETVLGDGLSFLSTRRLLLLLPPEGSGEGGL
jgi:hypothetical protein